MAQIIYMRLVIDPTKNLFTKSILIYCTGRLTVSRLMSAHLGVIHTLPSKKPFYTLARGVLGVPNVGKNTTDFREQFHYVQN